MSCVEESYSESQFDGSIAIDGTIACCTHASEFVFVDSDTAFVDSDTEIMDFGCRAERSNHDDVEFRRESENVVLTGFVAEHLENPDRFFSETHSFPNTGEKAV